MSLEMRMIQASAEIHGPTIANTQRLKGSVEKIAEQRRSQKRLGAGPARDMEGAFRMSAGRGRPRVMHAKHMLNDAAIDVMTRLDAAFRIDEETLAANGTANVRGYPRWLA